MMTEETVKRYYCVNCQIELVPCEMTFNYLEFSFHATVPCCPKCGFVYISKELAKGRMAEIEGILEDK